MVFRASLMGLVCALAFANSASAGCESGHLRLGRETEKSESLGFELLKPFGTNDQPPTPLPHCSGPECHDNEPAAPARDDSRFSPPRPSEWANLSAHRLSLSTRTANWPIDSVLVDPVQGGPSVFHPPR